VPSGPAPRRIGHRAGFLDYSHPAGTVDVVITKSALHQLPDFWKQRAPGMTAIAGYSVVCGASLSLSTIVWATLLQDRVPPDLISRVSSIDQFGTILLTPVGYLIAGPLAEEVGLRTTMVVLAVASVGLILITMCLPAVRAEAPPAVEAGSRCPAQAVASAA